jgi:MoxR-like ATPase
MRLSVGYPDHEAEVRVVLGDTAGVNPDELRPVIDVADVQRVIAEVRRAHLAPEIVSYAVRLAAASRSHPSVRYGASPRGSIALIRAAQALAATHGRDFVTPDDVKDVAHPVLGHRLVLTPDAELNLRRTGEVVDELLAETAAPAAETRR